MGFRKHESERTNVQQILQQILENGPISRRELQQLTGFSWGLISQVTNRLITDGYVVAEDDAYSTGVGRRAEMLDIVKNDHFFIGVDIDANGMYAVVTDMKGRLIESNRYDWPVREKDQVLQTLYDVLDRLMDQYHDKHITRIGVSAQGITNTEQGVSAYIIKIKDWVDVPLRDLLSSRYDVDVMVVHDPDCIMESEYAFGVLKRSRFKNVLLMHYNYATHSLGMSVMIDGQIYIGHRGRAAEIGYTILGEKADGTPELLVDLLLDPQVSAQKLCTGIGKAMAVANTMYNPELIVLHIPESPLKPLMIDEVKRWVRTSSYDAAVRIKISNLEHNANARGAAMIMINRAIDEMI